MCIEVQAQHIHAAGVFVSKNDTRPTLEAVCIRRERDAIKIQATDSYRLISIESNTEEDGPDEIILLPYKAVKAALPKKGPVTLCLNHQSMMLSITSCDGSSTTIKAIEGIYPDVEQLFKLPGKGTIDGTAQFGINAKFVADAGKACALALGSKGQDLRFTCTGELKPILFTNLRSDDTARVRGLTRHDKFMVDPERLSIADIGDEIIWEMYPGSEIEWWPEDVLPVRSSEL